jgi:hypothetical protein
MDASLGRDSESPLQGLVLQRLPRIANNTGLQSLILADPTDVIPWSFSHFSLHSMRPVARINSFSGS